jgi:hypothetical protein
VATHSLSHESSLSLSSPPMVHARLRSAARVWMPRPHPHAFLRRRTPRFSPSQAASMAFAGAPPIPLHHLLLVPPPLVAISARAGSSTARRWKGCPINGMALAAAAQEAHRLHLHAGIGCRPCLLPFLPPPLSLSAFKQLSATHLRKSIGETAFLRLVSSTPRAPICPFRCSIWIYFVGDSLIVLHWVTG